MWLSFTRRADERSIRWFWPPPQRTAYFSAARSPGRVLRVSRTAAPVPATSFTMAAVIVAIPERWVRMLRSVRSAASRVSAGPFNVPSTVLASTRAPSGTSTSAVAAPVPRRLLTSSSTSWAVTSPDTAPGCLETMDAPAGRAPTAAPVGSPSGRSSTTARAHHFPQSGPGRVERVQPANAVGHPTDCRWLISVTASRPRPSSPSASNWATWRTCHGRPLSG